MTKYTGPIVDAHHHFWNPELGRNPWLLPEAKIPFRYGSYDSIKRSYLPPDLLRDAEGFNIVGTVTMETEWDLDDPVGEMVYTQHVADKFGFPNAAVAHAVLNDPAVEQVLAEFSEFPLLRAVRNKPGQANSAREAAANPSLMVDSQWRKGFALLDRYDLKFDLQVAWWHADEAADLVRAFPWTRVIINHAFLPADRTPEGIAGWKEAIAMMARFDNVVIKVSGIGLPDKPWTVDNNRFVVDTIGEAFGAERMMAASNFPVDSLAGTYQEIMGGFVTMTEDWSPAEQKDFFIGTAVRTYDLPVELLETPRQNGPSIGISKKKEQNYDYSPTNYDSGGSVRSRS